MGFPPICAFVHAAYSEGMKPFLALFGRALVTLLLLAPQLSAQAVPAEAVGAGVRPSGGERAPIRVGVSGPFSGPSAPMGLSMREGIRIAAAELNAAPAGSFTPAFEKEQPKLPAMWRDSVK